MTKTLVERLRSPELSDTYKGRNWDVMEEAAKEIERLQRENAELRATGDARAQVAIATENELIRTRAQLRAVEPGVTHKCLLIANGSVPAPVCGAFKIRVGSEPISVLRRWLDELEKTYTQTDLFGMVIWSNEDLNINLRAAEKSGDQLCDSPDNHMQPCECLADSSPVKTPVSSGEKQNCRVCGAPLYPGTHWNCPIDER